MHVTWPCCPLQANGCKTGKRVVFLVNRCRIDIARSWNRSSGSRDGMLLHRRSILKALKCSTTWELFYLLLHLNLETFPPLSMTPKESNPLGGITGNSPIYNFYKTIQSRIWRAAECDAASYSFGSHGVAPTNWVIFGKRHKLCSCEAIRKQATLCVNTASPVSRLCRIRTKCAFCE